MSALFSPVNFGALALAHRVVLAPLTRMRAGVGDVPTDLMAKYYAQRASKGGLLITEATVVSKNGRGYLGTPGIYDAAQTAGWKKVTEAVHAKGSKIVMQLWHVGRVSHDSLQPGGVSPVGPSALTLEGGLAFTTDGWVPVTAARALEISEIRAIIEDFRQGTERAREAGFDGVEVHGANGYLLDQFLNDNSNIRTDEYGGSLENRARLLLQVVDAAASVIGADRVGVRIGPNNAFNGMGDSNPDKTFGYVAEQLNRFNLAYLHIIEPRVIGNEANASREQSPVGAQKLRRLFKNAIIGAGGFTPESGDAIVSAGDADAVAFGRAFIANPDLPERVRRKLPLNDYVRETFYGGAEEGYTDYPFLVETTEVA